MLRTRVIPALLLREASLVKTQKFGRFTYVGDPCNTVRIFNELEVDELLFLDIEATRRGREPNFKILAEIAGECFMPVAYGGGLRTIDHVERILSMGFEKVAINSHALEDAGFITRCAERFGSQAVIASIDVRYTLFGGQRVFSQSGRRNSGRLPADWAKTLAGAGAGEILLTSIDREGSWSGFDLGLVKSVSEAVDIPVIAHGGAGRIADIGAAVKSAGAAAVALGSMVMFQRQGMGVLVNFPDRAELEAVLQ